VDGRRATCVRAERIEDGAGVDAAAVLKKTADFARMAGPQCVHVEKAGGQTEPSDGLTQSPDIHVQPEDPGGGFEWRKKRACSAKVMSSSRKIAGTMNPNLGRIHAG
jgi:hypothetical protein